MRILIIATCFPTDTAISAVRPYMFAKYLTSFGHEVEVLCSGRINTKVDSSNAYPTSSMTVHTCQKPEQAAECSRTGKSRLWFIPYRIRKHIKSRYRKLLVNFSANQYRKNSQKRLQLQKAAIDQLADKQFDVVISTFGELENIEAGRYAAKVFGCKLLLDFRDPVVSFAKNSRQRAYYQKIQVQAVQSADICTTVSEDLAEKLAEGTDRKVEIIYNGYEESQLPLAEARDNCISFCYTGKIYARQKVSPIFTVLKQLIERGELSRNEIVFHYAGNHFDELLHQARKYHLDDCLIDHGYVDRKEAEALQKNSDFFVVMSWNNPGDVGVLTGKLYEGLRAKKPIIGLVSGTQAQSELRRIIEKYGLGCCYEQADEKITANALYEYLKEQIQYKEQHGSVRCEYTNDVAQMFRYDHIVERLNELITQL